ncbi:hypothetical protein, partial [Parvibaculum sp.]|uniref:hypothetical protein n=1 Tax=Parvibaculum sp. TaxID=2024848 RepID=UPI002FDAE230
SALDEKLGTAEEQEQAKHEKKDGQSLLPDERSRIDGVCGMRLREDRRQERKFISWTRKRL